MSKKIDPKDNQSNQKNSNKGTSGKNDAFKAAEKNKQKQRDSKKK